MGLLHSVLSLLRRFGFWFCSFVFLSAGYLKKWESASVGGSTTEEQVIHFEVETVKKGLNSYRIKKSKYLASSTLKPLAHAFHECLSLHIHWCQCGDFLLLNLCVQHSRWYVSSECFLIYVTGYKKITFLFLLLLLLLGSAVGVFPNFFLFFFSPTQDIHPTLELQGPFDCELRRCSGSISGHWYFGDYCLDLDKKQRKEQTVGATDRWIRLLVVGENHPWDSYLLKARLHQVLREEVSDEIEESIHAGHLVVLLSLSKIGLQLWVAGMDEQHQDHPQDGCDDRRRHVVDHGPGA